LVLSVLQDSGSCKCYRTDDVSVLDLRSFGTGDSGVQRIECKGDAKDMKKIYAINGLPESGKDAFVNFCLDELDDQDIIGVNASSVDMVKAAAGVLGWDGTKDDKGRQFLSRLKDLSTEFYEGPMTYMRELIEGDYTSDAVFFFHIREPYELQKFLDAFPGSEAILVTRPGTKTFDNTGDSQVHDFIGYHHLVTNNGTLDQLQQMAEMFVNRIVEEGRP
jgi:hypothetical protein